MSVEQTVLGMWHALSDRDWEKLKTFIADDCIYVDMPVGLAAAARGPEDIVKRLKVGTSRRFSATTEKTLVADLSTILGSRYSARAREISARMSNPAESVAAAADRVEDFARRETVG